MCRAGAVIVGVRSAPHVHVSEWTAGSWRTGAVDQVPRDPWDTEYVYRFPGKHNPKEYDIFSAGPDRNPETEEDNLGNWEQAN